MPYKATQSQKSKSRICTIFDQNKEENQKFSKNMAKFFTIFDKDHVHWTPEFLRFPELSLNWV